MMKLKAWLTCVAFISSHAMWVPTQLTRNENRRYSTSTQKTPVGSIMCEFTWMHKIVVTEKLYPAQNFMLHFVEFLFSVMHRLSLPTYSLHLFHVKQILSVLTILVKSTHMLKNCEYS